MQPGDTLGHRYQLKQLVASGRVGNLWAADDVVESRTVAIKVLRQSLSDNLGLREQFRAESLKIASINHPGVVAVHDYGQQQMPDGSVAAYTVMDLVEAQPLSRLLETENRLDIETALRIVADAAEALDELHQVAVIHRAVTPHNIQVRRDGSVVLTGFEITLPPGLRLSEEGEDDSDDLYMSPERAAGQLLTAASDIYSLGVVAYHSLAGEPPFQSSEAANLRSRHQFERPPRLPEDIPLSVNSVIMRALAKDPSARFATAKAMAVDIRQINHAATVLAPLLSDQTRPQPQLISTVRPPQPPPEPEPETEPLAQQPEPDPGDIIGHRARRGPARWVTVAAVALIAVTLVGIRFWPSADEGDSAAAGIDTTSSSAEQTTSSDSPSPTESTKSPSPTTSSPTPPPAPTTEPPPQQPSEPPSSTSESPTEDPKVTVPDVVGMSEGDAQAALSDKGFNVQTSESGSGDIACSVDSQDPSGGSKAKEGATVTIQVRMVENEAECSDPTVGPTTG